MKRIERIVGFIPTPTATGTPLWTVSVFTIALLLCIALTCCQGCRRATPKQAGTPETPATSLKPFLNIKGAQVHRVDKRVADFPADTIDLSTPEAAYASQKNLMVSSRKDKLEQLMNMQVGRPPVSALPERERKGLTEKIPDEMAKTYREQFDVFEVCMLDDTHAFVFGLRRSDMLYDGNYFEKQGDQWLNAGNVQAMNVEDIAKRLQQAAK